MKLPLQFYNINGICTYINHSLKGVTPKQFSIPLVTNYDANDLWEHVYDLLVNTGVIDLPMLMGLSIADITEVHYDTPKVKIISKPNKDKHCQAQVYYDNGILLVKDGRIPEITLIDVDDSITEIGDIVNIKFGKRSYRILY